MVAFFNCYYRNSEFLFISDSKPSPAALETIKQIPGRRYDPEKHAWSAPASSSAHVSAAAIAGFLKLSAAASAQVSKRNADMQSNLVGSQATDSEFHVDGLKKDLKSFQRAGVEFLFRNSSPGCVLADEMGLGKTPQTIAAVERLSAYPSIIVCPSSLKLNWKLELESWLVNCPNIIVLEGIKPKRISSIFKIVIVNFDILYGWIEPLLDYGAKSLIVDESHMCKNNSSRRTLAVRFLATGKNPEARKKKSKKRVLPDIKTKYKPIPNVFLLSGTPMLNSPIELVSQLSLIGRLNQFGGWKGFTSRYCIELPWGGFAQGGKNLRELGMMLRSYGIMIRREKSEVLSELPAKQRVRVPIEITNKKEYKKEHGDIKKLILEGDAAAQLRMINRLRLLSSRGKEKAAIEFISNMVDQGLKVIVFAYHREIVRSIADKFHAPTIMGSDDIEARQRAVIEFQNNDDCMVIVLNIKAGGVGLTLTKSSNVVFIEYAFTPGENDQAEDRAHRIGQKDSVSVWYLEGVGTVDAHILSIVDRKRHDVEALVSGGESSYVSEISGLVSEE